MNTRRSDRIDAATLTEWVTNNESVTILDVRFAAVTDTGRVT